MLVDELLEQFDIRFRLRNGRGRDRVPRHRYAEVVAFRVLQFPVVISVQGTLKEGEEGRTTPGKIFFRLSAAHCALGFPPSRQSSNVKSGWRTGFENETRALSTRVIVRTPHACHPYQHCISREGRRSAP